MEMKYRVSHRDNGWGVIVRYDTDEIVGIPFNIYPRCIMRDGIDLGWMPEDWNGYEEISYEEYQMYKVAGYTDWDAYNVKRITNEIRNKS
jgi:hypothetical protein